MLQVLYLTTQLHKFDQELISLGFIENPIDMYKSMTLGILATTLMITVLVVYLFSVDILTFTAFHLDLEFIGQTVLDRMPAVYSSYILLQICAFLAIVKQRYKCLNRKLKKVAFTCWKYKNDSSIGL